MSQYLRHAVRWLLLLTGLLLAAWVALSPSQASQPLSSSIADPMPGPPDELVRIQPEGPTRPEAPAAALAVPVAVAGHAASEHDIDAALDEPVDEEAPSTPDGPCDRAAGDAYERLKACEAELGSIRDAPLAEATFHAELRRLIALHMRFGDVAVGTQRESRVAAFTLMGEAFWIWKERAEGLSAEKCRELGTVTPECFQLMALQHEFEHCDQFDGKMREIYSAALAVADREGLDTQYSRRARERLRALTPRPKTNTR
jgi:hypothetical protein